MAAAATPRGADANGGAAADENGRKANRHGAGQLGPTRRLFGGGSAAMQIFCTRKKLFRLVADLL